MQCYINSIRIQKKRLPSRLAHSSQKLYTLCVDHVVSIDLKGCDLLNPHQKGSTLVVSQGESLDSKQRDSFILTEIQQAELPTTTGRGRRPSSASSP
jgi:hypothetical protein